MSAWSTWNRSWISAPAGSQRLVDLEPGLDVLVEHLDVLVEHHLVGVRRGLLVDLEQELDLNIMVDDLEPDLDVLCWSSTMSAWSTWNRSWISAPAGSQRLVDLEPGLDVLVEHLDVLVEHHLVGVRRGLLVDLEQELDLNSWSTWNPVWMCWSSTMSAWSTWNRSWISTSWSTTWNARSGCAVLVEHLDVLVEHQLASWSSTWNPIWMLHGRRPWSAWSTWNRSCISTTSWSAWSTWNRSWISTSWSTTWNPIWMCCAGRAP